MRRLWFKKEMRDAILDGRKTATSRLHPLIVGEDCLAKVESYEAARAEERKVFEEKVRRLVQVDPDELASNVQWDSGYSQAIDDVLGLIAEASNTTTAEADSQ